MCIHLFGIPVCANSSGLLTPWNTALENLIVAQLVKKFLSFREREGSLPHSQKPATDPYTEPEFSPHSTTLFF
jgi:hypothetical protein